MRRERTARPPVATARTPSRRHGEHDADDEAEAELADDEEDELVETLRVRALDPGDQAERQSDRHRVVAPDSASSVRASRRLICVKRSVANTAQRPVDATTAPSKNASSQ